jgi:DNA-binding transcriptional regulator YiaG
MAAKKKPKAPAPRRPWYADATRDLVRDVLAHMRRGKHRVTKDQLCLFLGISLDELESLEAGLSSPTGRLLHALLHLIELQKQHRKGTTTTTRKNTKA